MNSSDINQKKELLEVLKRRLHGRELQLATLGVSADPSIPIEIRDLKKEVDGLELEIALLLAENSLATKVRNAHPFGEHLQHYPVLEQVFKNADGQWDRIPPQYRDMIMGIQRIAEGYQRRSYVAILGSGILDDPRRVELCETVGIFLARSGHTLIHGSSDVGQRVARAFHSINSNLGYIFNYRIREKEALPFGIMVYFNKLNELRQAMANSADFFIMIGGGSGTAREIKLAKERGKDVFVFREDLLG
jgi:hypothetical protein